jgi:hypothetical protein
MPHTTSAAVSSACVGSCAEAKRRAGPAGSASVWIAYGPEYCGLALLCERVLSRLRWVPLARCADTPPNMQMQLAEAAASAGEQIRLRPPPRS